MRGRKQLEVKSFQVPKVKAYEKFQTTLDTYN